MLGKLTLQFHNIKHPLCVFYYFKGNNGVDFALTLNKIVIMCPELFAQNI